jgi:hypothetical protein
MFEPGKAGFDVAQLSAWIDVRDAYCSGLFLNLDPENGERGMRSHSMLANTRLVSVRALPPAIKRTAAR